MKPIGRVFNTPAKSISDFKSRNSLRPNHNGIDIQPIGSDYTVYAPIDGKLTYWPANKEYRESEKNISGNGLYIWGDDYLIGMFHNDRYLVPENIYVRKGQPIAIMGKTGNARNTPPHVHFEISVKNNIGKYDLVDPTDFVIENNNQKKDVITFIRQPKKQEEKPEVKTNKEIDMKTIAAVFALTVLISFIIL